MSCLSALVLDLTGGGASRPRGPAPNRPERRQSASARGAPHGCARQGPVPGRSRLGRRPIWAGVRGWRLFPWRRRSFGVVPYRDRESVDLRLGATSPCTLAGVVVWLFALWDRLTASILRHRIGGGIREVSARDPAQAALRHVRGSLRRAVSKGGCTEDGIASHGASNVGDGAREARRDTAAQPPLPRPSEDRVESLRPFLSNGVAEAPRGAKAQAHKRRSMTLDLAAPFGPEERIGAGERAEVLVRRPAAAARFGSRIPTAPSLAEQLSLVSVLGDDRASDRDCLAGRLPHSRSRRGPCRDGACGKSDKGGRQLRAKALSDRFPSEAGTRGLSKPSSPGAFGSRSGFGGRSVRCLEGTPHSPRRSRARRR